jgi:hypothetical protein
MKVDELPAPPVPGKTYNLFGDTESTDGFYSDIKELVDDLVEEVPDIQALIDSIQKVTHRKRYLRSIVQRNDSGELPGKLLHKITPVLNKYTGETEGHLRGLSLWKKMRDKRLATTREQYHLYMLEIGLTNRLYSDAFKKAKRKIALLPHCLRDLTVSCKKAKDGFDYQCRHCSLNCFQNAVATMLEKFGIEPYIWMGSDFKKLARYTLKSGKTFSVLGIACIPELTMGMRKCRKHHIPVLGLPLDANRCIRWFGEFRPNSVNLSELEKLLT